MQEIYQVSRRVSEIAAGTEIAQAYINQQEHGNNIGTTLSEQGPSFPFISVLPSFNRYAFKNTPMGIYFRLWIKELF